MRVIDDPAGERRKIRRRPRRADPQRGEEGRQSVARGQKRSIRALPSEDQNFTFGAVCASASAVKGTIGFASRNTVCAQIMVGKVLSEVL